MKRTITTILFVLTALCNISCNKNEGLQESQLIYFGITEPYTRIGGIGFTVDNTTLTITNNDPIPADVDLTNVTPYFVTNHEGKGVFVKGVEQKSGVTKQNLSSPVIYEVVSERGTLKYTVEVTQSESVHTQAGIILSGISDFVDEIGEEKEQWIAEGVRFSEVNFKMQNNGRKLKMDVFEVDLSRDNLKLYPLTANNSGEIYPEGTEWPIQTIPDQATAAENAGMKVLGAVSGDFFEASGKTIPEGPLCRDGNWMKLSFASEMANHYFGMRNDGRASIGDNTDCYRLSEMMTFAIGAKDYLLQGNAPAEKIKSDKNLSSRVGIGTNGLDHKTVYIVCLDGPSGATLLELAKIMKAFGAAEAVNLVGGDYATFAIKEDGKFKAVNRNTELVKEVVNGIAIVKK